VILSSVRTKWPGFLKAQPRMNVALTRCRKGMVVITDKSFLQGRGKKTLLGQLCRTWSKHHDACWNDWKAVLNDSVTLPGLPPPSQSNSTRSPSGRATTARRKPPSQARTQSRTHHGQESLSKSVAVGRRGKDDKFPSLGSLATALDQSSRRRSRKGRK